MASLAHTRRDSVVQQLADVKRALDHAAIVATTDVTGKINDLMVFARPRLPRPTLIQATLTLPLRPVLPEQVSA